MSRMHAPDDQQDNLTGTDTGGPADGDCPFCGASYAHSLARHLPARPKHP